MATNYKEVIYKTSLSLWVVLNENEEKNYLITELKKENDKLKKENITLNKKLDNNIFKNTYYNYDEIYNILSDWPTFQRVSDVNEREKLIEEYIDEIKIRTDEWVRYKLFN